MKKFLISAIVALATVFAPATANAQEPVAYSSEKVGITVIVPDIANVVTEEDDLLVVQTEDQMFTLTVIPFNPAETSEDELAQGFATLGKAAKLDTSNLTEVEMKSETLEGVFKTSPIEGGISAVGILGCEDGGFLVSLVLSDQYADYLQYAQQQTELAGDDEEE